MTLLTIAVLAASVIESRDRVRRDFLTSDASLRAWYEARYTRRGREFDRDNLERALASAQNLRRWGPLALSTGTLVMALVLTYMAASTVPGIESVWRAPERLTDLVSSEVLVQAAIIFLLIPILVIEGILAALYTADFDIGRLQRLLESLD